MAGTIQDYKTTLDAIEATTDGLISDTSLEAVFTAAQLVLKAIGVSVYSTTTLMTAANITIEPATAIVPGTGIFCLVPIGVLTVNGTTVFASSSVSYVWQLQVAQWSIGSATDAAVTSPANNQTLIYNSGTSKWTNGTVPIPTIAYSALSPKPDFTGTTNPVTGGNLSVGGTLAVTGATTLSANTTVAGTLGVTGNIAVNTNKLTVAASSGNTAIAGTLTTVGGITSSGGGLQVNGDINGDGDLNVTSGTANLSGAVIDSLTLQSLLFLPQWTNGTRPSTSVAGCIGYNTTLDQIEYRGNSAWHQL